MKVAIMKTRWITLFVIVGAFTAGFAQEESGFSFEDDFSWSEESESSNPSISISGDLKYDNRIYTTRDGQPVEDLPDLHLNFSKESAGSQFSATLRLDSYEQRPVFDEAWMRVMGENWELKLGKMRHIWGQGDRVHVVDHFNARDYLDPTDFEYLDNLIAQSMIIAQWLPGGGTRNMLLEAIYTPEFLPHRYAMEGYWVSSEFDLLTQQMMNYALLTGGTASMSYMEEQYNAFEDGQFGLRWLQTIGGADLGVSWYHGKLRESPTVKTMIDPSWDGTPGTFPNLTLQLGYEPLDVFGLEGAFGLPFGFGGRMEMAYWQTEDSEGDDPEARNSSLNYMLGVDRSLPIHNISINLQVKGTQLLARDDLDVVHTNALGIPFNDIDYRADGYYGRHMVMLFLDDSFRYQTINPGIIVAANLETEDYLLVGELEVSLTDEVDLCLRYKHIEGDAGTQLGDFKDNDHISIQATYHF